MANYRNNNVFNINSQIFKFNGTAFVPFQSLPTSGAADWEYFNINNNQSCYLAVANHYDGASFNISSQIFKFNGTLFVALQSIQTSGANDWEYFSINNQSYLAAANHLYNITNYNINSQIFKFNGTVFVALQSIPTSGARDWKYFSINHQSYLAVANAQNTTSDGGANINSQIFKFDATGSAQFVAFQSIPTSGAWDWEYFSVNSQSYLALANRNFNDTSYNIDSQIFSLSLCW